MGICRPVGWSVGLPCIFLLFFPSQWCMLRHWLIICCFSNSYRYNYSRYFFGCGGSQIAEFILVSVFVGGEGITWWYDPSSELP
ncbi:hypothetical protein B9Z19DRAFT_1097478 [Tuber borchii]|uniref:Uncharacterized protein n=1 Tax=Tuber borchii TaxID=42251 RepID=A0A2T6ZA58_TUBBO|nr:hypothetical protein B9Z19DRAFT_1097478 [Tuber borchii]